MPLPDKLQAIKHIAVPTNKKQLRCSIGVINYYTDMCANTDWIFKVFN